MYTYIRNPVVLAASFACLLFSLAAQLTFAQERDTTFSLIPYFKTLDTIDREGKDPLVKIQWLDTIIDLRVPLSLTQRRQGLHKFRELYAKKGEVFDSVQYLFSFLTGVQNCHSYALERYLASIKVQDNTIFTSSTSLFNPEMAKVLEVSFKRIQRYTSKEMKKNHNILPHKTLLVFKDKDEIPIHTVFYDQEFYSKNGLLSPITVEKIKPLLDTYFYTVWVDLYEIDSSKFANYKN